ncbi:DUF72 domain-containing protein [bacterium]|nr:DUF72 domain-containing protein [bacterium]
MKIYVGTSGWLYDWNEGKNFDWFVENSLLNSVELNASFYRFPFPNQINSWAKKCKNIRFAIKVHRKITHVLRLKEEAKSVWYDFKNLFSPLEDKIDFYLFQLPPSFSIEYLERVKKFFENEKKEKIAIEFRHKTWFDEKGVKEIEKIGIIFVSVDSPQIKSFIVKTKDTIYLRFHGRTGWYNHNYSEEELWEISEKVKKLNPEKIYAYFNNNHNMLSNAQVFFRLLSDLNG